MNSVALFFQELLEVFLVSAPALLAGLLLAGVLKVFVPERLIERHLAKRGPGAVIKGALLGIPLPLCSCSVIPVAIMLRRRGASRGAVTSFLICTPEIGADSFFLTLSLLGGNFTVLRIVTAFLSAMIVGVAVDLLGGPETGPRPVTNPQAPSCCGDDACGGGSGERLPPSDKLRKILSYGFDTLLRDLSVYLGIGLLAAAAIATFLPADTLGPERMNPHLGLIVFFLLSIPTYVCAAATTPVAAAFLSKGASAGSVLVFLLAGPATNPTTIAAIRGEIGKRSLVIYLIAVAAVTLFIGWCTDLFFLPATGIPGSPGAHRHEAASGLNAAAGIVFGVLWARVAFAAVFRKRSCCH